MGSNYIKYIKGLVIIKILITIGTEENIEYSDILQISEVGKIHVLHMTY